MLGSPFWNYNNAVCFVLPNTCCYFLQSVKKACTGTQGTQDKETLKLYIYSGSKKMNLWVANQIRNFNKHLRIKLPFCFIFKFSKKFVYLNSFFLGMSNAEMRKLFLKHHNHIAFSIYLHFYLHF